MNRPAFVVYYDRMITIYTDGSARGNPGPAGWAYARSDENKIVGDSVKHATNNQMELTAIQMALKSVPDKSDVLIVTDSKFAVGVVDGHWRMSRPHLVMLQMQINDLIDTKRLTVTCQWVDGRDRSPMKVAVEQEAHRQSRNEQNLKRLPRFLDGD